jgi:2-aminoadipate transaminase
VEIRPNFNPQSGVPIYRQLGSYLQRLIETGDLRSGDRLPPTRELAGQLGLNRTTISAAYDLLETVGLIKGEVGRGSYVCGGPERSRQAATGDALNWSRALTASVSTSAPAGTGGAINFTSSRPSEKLFPIEEFRECCREVLEGRNLKALMQLGSPGGYEPLRRYLLDRAIQNGIARDSDDILITNGCQQALDLLRRALVRTGEKVALEEPVYPGLKNLFLEAGAQLIGVPSDGDGIDLYSVQRAFESGAKVLVVTPSFQNPTGATMPAAHRVEICRMAGAAGVAVIENDIYSELAYEGNSLPRLKQLDSNVVLLGSFSKIAFPGIRVGWVIAPRPVIARATELKQLADLHTDHLSQAFLLRFAESGKLARHQAIVIAAAKEKLRALDQSCRRYLPSCTWRVPAGGMNMWIQLPPGLDATALRGLAQQAGIDYLPGRYFSVSRPLDSGLRLSFAGLDPHEIRKGIEILGALVQNAVSARESRDAHPAMALV